MIFVRESMPNFICRVVFYENVSSHSERNKIFEQPASFTADITPGVYCSVDIIMNLAGMFANRWPSDYAKMPARFMLLLYAPDSIMRESGYQTGNSLPAA